MTHQSKSYKKFVATAATATLVATAIAPVASAANFTDVSNDYKVAVDYLTANGIANGLTDTTFGTSQNITRGDAAVMIANALNLDTASAPSAGFTDVNTRVAGAVNAIVYADIASGRTATKFDPAANITRQEMAKMLANAYGLVASSNANFTDVNNNWIGFVSALKDAGITQGKTETTFAPTANLTRGEFALFMYRAKDLAPVSAVVESVNAINNTTVEVTFKEELSSDDVKALDFAIEGLTVENAVAKQTNKKVVVLTTSKQEGDKVYTVTEHGEKIGTFKGVSAVIPTKVDVVEKSIQGTIGKEVTVQAKVTVPEGQSAAGVPVTFNINTANNSDAGKNAKIEVEAFTNADGVAEYSYTRYYKHNDEVTAYATDKSSVFSNGKVYWAEALTIKEVTEKNTLANGSKKVYKVTGTPNSTVSVAFEENIDVNPNKVIRTVDVIDHNGVNLGYPYEVTTGGTQKVQFKLNANGEATFTITGKDATVTPIVFIDENNDEKFTATELYAKAESVTFELVHVLGLSIKAEGAQQSAAYITPPTASNQVNKGGRKYVVTATDEDGKAVPKGTPVHVVFEEGSIDPNTPVYRTDKDGNVSSVAVDTVYTYVADKDGQFEFRLFGGKDGYATPTVFRDNGNSTSPVKLDPADLQAKGEITYFVNALVNDASFKAYFDGKAVESTGGENTVAFEYQSLDQNKFPYYADNGDYNVSFEVRAGANDLQVTGSFIGGGNSKTVKAGKTETVSVKANQGKALINVTSNGEISTATVNASSSQHTLPNKTATVNFTESHVLAENTTYAGTVKKIDKTAKTITLEIGGRDYVISYKDGDAKRFIDGNDSPISDFENIEVGDAVDYTKGAKDKLDELNWTTITTTATYVFGPIPTNPADRTNQIGTITTPYLSTIAPTPAKYTSGVVADYSFSDHSTIKITIDGNDETITFMANDTATTMASKINAKTVHASSNPGTLEAVASVSNGRVVITADDVTHTVQVSDSNITPLFQNGTNNPTAGRAVQAAVYDYDFSLVLPEGALPGTTADLVEGDTVKFNGIVYTASNTNNTTKKTFDASGNLTADLNNLKAVIDVVDGKAGTEYIVTVTGGGTDTLTVTEQGTHEGKFNRNNFEVKLNR